jgi:hypothetical protein
LGFGFGIWDLTPLRHAPCFCMGSQEARRVPRPYDIRERLFLFACAVVAAAQKMQSRSSIAAALCPNLVAAAASAAANAEEADDASSLRDFVAKERIALREIKGGAPAPESDAECGLSRPVGRLAD